jgi:hypothetical protein
MAWSAVSDTPDKNLSSRMSLSSSAEMLLPHTEGQGVADAMIEALDVRKYNNSLPRINPESAILTSRIT